MNMNIIETVLDAIEKERPQLASWCEDQRHSLADQGKLESLRWVTERLDGQNKGIAARALGIMDDDLDALGRVLKVV